MVVGLATAAIQMGMALPTGFLFGVGYGTGVRIGYEQVYPLLFPKGARSTTSELAATMKGMNTVYDAIGGKDASRMGIAVGITNAGEILNNPDFQVLEKLESSSSGLTSSNLNQTPVSGTSASSQELAPSFSSIPQKDSIFFSKPTLTLSEKQFLIKQINQSKDVAYLARIRRQYTDPNLIQIIEARIRQLRSPTITQKIVNTVPTRPPAPTRPTTTPEQEFNIWRDKLFQLNKLFISIVGGRNITKRSNLPATAKEIRRKIVLMSNDYRSPNNLIRRAALHLRNNINSGFYAV